MKRVPPKIGFAILEQEDREQLPEHAKLKLVALWAGQLGFVVGLFSHALLL